MSFDLRVHHRDAKTGRVTRITPYKLVIENGQRIYVRDGVKYFENGDLVEQPESKVASEASIEQKVAQLLPKDDNKPVNSNSKK